MRRFVLCALGIAVVSLALAINPPVRLGLLRDCDRLVIKYEGHEDIELFTKDSVRSFLRYIDVDSSSANRTSAGKPAFTLVFYRGYSEKPTDTLWVDKAGQWGFHKVRTVYGQNRDLVEKLEKLFKQ